MYTAPNTFTPSPPPAAHTKNILQQDKMILNITFVKCAVMLIIVYVGETELFTSQLINYYTEHDEIYYEDIKLHNTSSSI